MLAIGNQCYVSVPMLKTVWSIAVVIAGQPPGEPMPEGDNPEGASASAACNAETR